jgi:hypothetical protein
MRPTGSFDFFGGENLDETGGSFDRIFFVKKLKPEVLLIWQCFGKKN